MKQQYIRAILSALYLLVIIAYFVFYAPKVFAFTQPLQTNSQIQYPISLSTGLDAAGEEVFPDKNFWEYIKKETFPTGSYAGYTFDLDEDGFLSREECENVRILSVSERKDITNVKGIEAFPKLREFYCSSSGITEIDLSKNPRIQILVCSDNAITSLDVSGCPLLKDLKVSGCHLSSLDLHHNQKLEFLTCMTQTRRICEYSEEGKYKIKLTDWDKAADLSRVSQVTIDGAPGDGINSGYDAQTGTIYCTDVIKSISYDYEVDLGGISDESIDQKMSVTFHAEPGVREAYETNGGTKVLPQYLEAGSKDTEPEKPERAGYHFTGWFTQKDADAASRWAFGRALSGNITLYAGWEKKAYRIFYNPAGGTLAETERTGTVDWWTTDLLPSEIPVRDGFALTGWKTESGRILTAANAAAVTYGQASGDSRKESTTLTAQWEAARGYQLSFATGFTDERKDQAEYMPEEIVKDGFLWSTTDLIPEIQPLMRGYDFAGWYTAPTGGTKVTEETTYGDVYRSQFTGSQTGQIPTLYARFEKKHLTIYYDERGGSKVADRTGILWGSKNLLPATKTKKKNYLFAGWKCNGVKVTKKTSMDSISDGYDDSITLTAMWYKKYEKKGTIFKRYGCRYRVVQSNKKGNKVRLISTKRKRVILRNKIFYNGKMFTVSSIQKKALKKKKVVLRVPGKKVKKYRRMAKRAGGKIKKR